MAYYSLLFATRVTPNVMFTGEQRALCVLVPGGRTETPPCFEEIIRRGIYTCSRVLWFRKPRRGHASVRFQQYCVHCSCVECESSFMRYSAEQRIFICYTFMKKSSWRKCPHTLNELKEISEIHNISQNELQKVSANVLKRCEACVKAGGHHFQHL